MGPPKKICVAKIFWGLFSGFPKIFFAEKDFWEHFDGVPKKDLRSKDFLGKGGASAQNVVFAVRQIPEKSALRRRGAADRPRTDTPFRHRILSPARLPISPRRHMRRPEKDGAGVIVLIIRLPGRVRRRRLRAHLHSKRRGEVLARAVPRQGRRLPYRARRRRYAP